jgi:WXG100 family type VII secretion target
MPQKIRMKYPQMQTMAQTFQAGAQQLNETKGQMQAIANQMQSGALQGDGGTAFTDAINTRLVPAITRLEAKFGELQRDVLKAMAEMQAADRESKSRLGG